MVNHLEQYARCYCTSCRGATVTRKTFRRHTNRPQRYPGVNERICTRSRHPHGKIVHRATYGRHRRKDVDDKSSETPSTLHAYFMLISADGLASADAIRMKKPGNLYRPCHQCSIIATLGLNRTYYISHSLKMDLHDLSPRKNLRKVFALWEALADPKRKKEMSQELGLVKSSILMELLKLHFPRSFPLDLMHCVLQNIMPELFRLWGGKEMTRRQESKNQRA